ncbi:leucine-rich repeat domain-containing protein [bacterium]|nr:leucine-rich repeat domain-containing protein [bacterium]
MRQILPEGLRKIGCQAFEYCRGLVEMNIPSSVEEIGESAFSCCSLPAVRLPADIKIGRFAGPHHYYMV